MASENWDAEQDETGCQQPAGPVLCANNCGFFGSPATMNLCSKCYRDAVLHKADAAVAAGERPVSPLFGDQVLFPSIPGKLPDVTASSAGKSDGESFLFGDKVLFPSIPGKLSDVTASSAGEGFLFGENGYVVRDFKGKPKCWKSDMPAHPFDAFRNTCEGASGSSEEVAPALDMVLEKTEQPAKVPNRCCACKKRVGLTGFKCRCGDTFCALHRYSDKHNCKFDYKAVAQEAIAKANPVVKANKVDKI